MSYRVIRCRPDTKLGIVEATNTQTTSHQCAEKKGKCLLAMMAATLAASAPSWWKGETSSNQLTKMSDDQSCPLDSSAPWSLCF